MPLSIILLKVSSSSSSIGLSESPRSRWSVSLTKFYPSSDPTLENQVPVGVIAALRAMCMTGLPGPPPVIRPRCDADRTGLVRGGRGVPYDQPFVTSCVHG